MAAASSKEEEAANIRQSRLEGVEILSASQTGGNRTWAVKARDSLLLGTWALFLSLP